jgi:hypothetical protein
MEASGQLYASAALPVRNDRSTHSVGDWVGHRACPNVLEERKISRPCQDSNPRSSHPQTTHYVNWLCININIIRNHNILILYITFNLFVNIFLRPFHLYEKIKVEVIFWSPYYMCLQNVKKIITSLFASLLGGEIDRHPNFILSWIFPLHRHSRVWDS